MDVFAIPRDRAHALAAALMRDHRLLAPVRRNEEVVFGQVTSPDEVVWGYRNTAKSPKAAFFPQTECMMRFARQLDRYNEVEAVPLDDTPTVILGMRPCDARSLLLLDGVFLGARYLDPYYRARREHTTIVSLACDHPRPTCFCHAFGSGPYDRTGSDLFMREAGDAGYLIEATSDRGADLLGVLREVTGLLDPASVDQLAQAGEIEAQARARLHQVEPVAGVEAMLATLFDDPVWASIAEKCIACGTCTYICPECHCFNIEDRLVAGGGQRMRGWDSCMFPTFTLHASGHNPRPDQGARWRQRTMHKFEYLPRNLGLYGCVGCGRCILSCPVRLDIRNVLERVRAAYAQKSVALAGAAKSTG